MERILAKVPVYGHHTNHMIQDLWDHAIRKIQEITEVSQEKPGKETLRKFLMKTIDAINCLEMQVDNILSVIYGDQEGKEDFETQVPK
ncbi:hypothetical protein [Candidatus Borrarchaeum sp.]|uniref:hypothetical protein n=1 Tax=Candidatus Borrarchaeum sp. TaxID=2846742 RepID=UPI00257F74B6|nr:hypothetical protein [Candidatus Borrarchaeum sp.]